ncbi:MAG TPA: TerB family tellurite resistance protein [Tabrizicola sp.]|nr:TerB family tellurite resistance protein [Tabrizicola sp.]
MIDILRRLLAPEPARLPEPDARLALAALLVRIARTDGLYAAEEVERIDRILAQYHGLGPFEAAKLRTEAEDLERNAPDTVRFTRALKLAVALEDRADLMAALWSVVIADGLRDAEEDRLMRMVASLLGLTDVESAQARQRAERRDSAE